MSDIKDILNEIEGEISEKDKTLIDKAFHFAKKAHEGQKRLSGEPYFIHVYETAKILAKQGMDANTIAAGFMHDVLEDAEVSEQEIEKEFGNEILFLIKGVTKLGKLKYRGHERHVESLRKFFMAMANDLRVVIIKFADRLHNLRTLEYIREEKRERIAIESIEIYAPLANRLGMGKLKSEIEEVAFPYAYPKEYKLVTDMLKEKEVEYHKDLEEIRNALEAELKKENIKFDEISYRVKTKYSLWRKLQRYDMDIDKIHDIIAIRVVVDTLEECYHILGLIHSLWKPIQGRIKDYISLPKPNGYKSLHTTVFTGKNGIAEIQVRTKEMHAEAAYGIAAHFAYKENAKKKKNDDKEKFKWLEELKELNYNPNKPQSFFEHLKMDFFNDRIFILTPRGDVVDLPENSSPIDFAYSIHSDLGNHVSGVKINGKMSQIFSKLKNGDIVEIIDKADAHPSSKWLENTKTNIAKKHIKSYVEKNSLLAKLKSFGRS
ncbi:MAG: GTP pyrophosphokinase [Candidatus Nomurabacteria bacterium GW2011_GWA2_40_9]|uniref:GTP pyrophosphokinase n=1 Tax=Candidatus Nomurabacteria bacterium GW2011_GWA2_40_9 TaxID=1618734 RepID=A0A0G0WVL2_9BACT|nr:MAG: GTP pyrophosphokinase [Candidatus Nomurabacteria bacterium GW2011_GWA2_40_9]